MDITEAIKAKGYEIDRRQVSLRDAIKETGNYTVNVKLHRDVVLQVPVTVTAEGGEAPEPKADKKARKETSATDTEDAAPEAADTAENTEA
jgi:large subunit ribosomal protein L9